MQSNLSQSEKDLFCTQSMMTNGFHSQEQKQRQPVMSGGGDGGGGGVSNGHHQQQHYEPPHQTQFQTPQVFKSFLY